MGQGNAVPHVPQLADVADACRSLLFRPRLYTPFGLLGADSGHEICSLFSLLCIDRTKYRRIQRIQLYSCSQSYSAACFDEINSS